MFKAANISEYQGRPLRLQRHGTRSFACASAKRHPCPAFMDQLTDRTWGSAPPVWSAFWSPGIANGGARCGERSRPSEANRNGVVGKESKAESARLDA